LNLSGLLQPKQRRLPRASAGLRMALPSSIDAPCGDGVGKIHAKPNRSQTRKLACKRPVQDSYWHCRPNWTQLAVAASAYSSKDHQHGPELETAADVTSLHTCCVLGQCCMKFVFVCLSYSQRPNFCPLQATDAGCCSSDAAPAVLCWAPSFVYPAAAGKSRSGPLVGCYCCCCCCCWWC
jgi:hypothetical protein